MLSSSRARNRSELVEQLSKLRNYKKINPFTKARLLVYLGKGWPIKEVAILLEVHLDTLRKFVKRLKDAGELLVVANLTPMPATVAWLLKIGYVDMPADECLHWPDKPKRNVLLCKLLTYLERTVDTMDICVFAITCKQLGAAVRATKQRKVVVHIVCDYDQMFNKDPRLWISSSPCSSCQPQCITSSQSWMAESSSMDLSTGRSASNVEKKISRCK